MANHPNRSGRTAPGSTPSAADVRALRELHGLTQTQFAEVIHGTMRAVQDYEGGQRRMHPAIFGYARARLGYPVQEYSSK